MIPEIARVEEALDRVADMDWSQLTPSELVAAVIALDTVGDDLRRMERKAHAAVLRRGHTDAR